MMYELFTLKRLLQKHAILTLSNKWNISPSEPKNWTQKLIFFSLVRLWFINNTANEHTICFQNLLRCAWSPDGSKVTAGSGDRFVYIWDTTSRRILYKLPGHTGSINEVDFHPTENIGMWSCLVNTYRNNIPHFLCACNFSAINISVSK